MSGKQSGMNSRQLRLSIDSRICASPSSLHSPSSPHSPPADVFGDGFAGTGSLDPHIPELLSRLRPGRL